MSGDCLFKGNPTCVFLEVNGVFALENYEP